MVLRPFPPVRVTVVLTCDRGLGLRRSRVPSLGRGHLSLMAPRARPFTLKSTKLGPPLSGKKRVRLCLRRCMAKGPILIPRVPFPSIKLKLTGTCRLNRLSASSALLLPVRARATASPVSPSLLL